MNWICNLFGHSLITGNEGIEGPCHCGRCDYIEPRFVWPRYPGDRDVWLTPGECKVAFALDGGFFVEPVKCKIDYEDLLKKYIKHVTQCEGISFIDELNYIDSSDIKFTEDECVVLIEMDKEKYE